VASPPLSLQCGPHKGRRPRPAHRGSHRVPAVGQRHCSRTPVPCAYASDGGGGGDWKPPRPAQRGEGGQHLHGQKPPLDCPIAPRCYPHRLCVRPSYTATQRAVAGGGTHRRQDTGGGCADSAVTTTGNGRTNRGENSIIAPSPPPSLLPPPPRRLRRHPRQAPTAMVALGQDPHSTITRPRAIRKEGNKRDTPAEAETAGRGNSNKPKNRLGAPSTKRRRCLQAQQGRGMPRGARFINSAPIELHSESLESLN